MIVRQQLAQKTKFVRRRMRRGILVRGGILIACVIGLGAVLLIQTERQYNLQRKINTLKTDIKQLQADNETYQNELDFLDIPNIKKVAQRTGLRATNPDQIIILDFAAWATTNDVPVIPATNDLWTATIAPAESSNVIDAATATASSAPVVSDQLADIQGTATGHIATFAPDVTQNTEKKTSSPVVSSKSTVTPQATQEQETDDFDSIIPEATSNGDTVDESSIEIMEEAE